MRVAYPVNPEAGYPTPSLLPTPSEGSTGQSFLLLFSHEISLIVTNPQSQTATGHNFPSGKKNSSSDNMFHEDAAGIYCGRGNCIKRINGFPKVKADSVAKARTESHPWVS